MPNGTIAKFIVAAIAGAFAVPATPALAAERHTYRTDEASPAPAAAQLAEMTALYDTICLKTFPDEAGVKAALAARGAHPMSDAGVHAYLHDDPGFGWEVTGTAGTYWVTIELPPYRACSVRTLTRAGFADLGPYEAAAAAYKATVGAFQTIPYPKRTIDGIAVDGTGEGILKADGTTETLATVTGAIVDPVARAAGATAIEVRFVHQIVRPAGRGAT